MLPRPDPLRAGRALVDTTLFSFQRSSSVESDLRRPRPRSQVESSAFADSSGRWVWSPRVSRDSKLSLRNSLPNRKLSPAATNPRLRSSRGWPFRLETRDSKQAGRLSQRAHLPQIPIRKPFAYQPPVNSSQPRSWVTLTPLPSSWQSEMIPPCRVKSKRNFSPATSGLPRFRSRTRPSADSPQPSVS
jgi:hypothetical protein